MRRTGAIALVLLVAGVSTAVAQRRGGFPGGGYGMRGFRQALRGDLLAAAYAQGRGGAADGLLPPGVAPLRPLPEPQGKYTVKREPLPGLESTSTHPECWRTKP